MTLPGASRVRACEGVTRGPDYVPLSQLSASRVRAMIAAKLAKLKHGGDRIKASNDALTQDQAAELLSVSPASLDRAKYVLEHGSKQLIDAVEGCVLFDMRHG